MREAHEALADTACTDTIRVAKRSIHFFGRERITRSMTLAIMNVSCTSIVRM